MGEVWRAFDTRMHRQVAIKRLPVAGVDDADVDLFRREARLMAGLEAHPHIISLYDFGVADDLYLVMPYIQGHHLGEEIQKLGSLPPARVLRIVDQIAKALDRAHKAGLVHRDVTPRNVLLADGYGDDFVYLIDFGIASGGTRTDTSVAAARGTVAYMAPERLSEPDSAAARGPGVDIYSLGCVAYQLLTGHAPFEADDAFAVARMHLEHESPRATQLPAAANDAIAKALAKRPEHRFTTAGAFAHHLTSAFDPRSPRSAQPAVKHIRDVRPPAEPTPQKTPPEAKRVGYLHLPPPGSPAGVERDAGFNRAAALVRGGHYMDAVRVCNKLLAYFGDVTQPAPRERVAKALLYKGIALAQLGRSEDALQAYDQLLGRFVDATEPALREQVAKALFEKGYRLGRLGRPKEELQAYDQVETRFGDATESALREQVAKALFEKGLALTRDRGLSPDRSEEAFRVYDQLLDRFGDATEPALRVQVAKALLDKGYRLGRKGRSEEELQAYDQLLDRYGRATEPALRELVARTLLTKGVTLARLGRSEDALQAYDQLLDRFGDATEPALREQAAKAKGLATAARR